MVMITPLTAGTAALLGLQSWASSLYKYNRDAFMTDIQVRQQHAYQKQNMGLSRLALGRQEVRDLMQQDIQKIGASMLVTTLLLALAGEMLFEGQIPGESPPFLLNVYIISLGSGMLYMALSILFGMCASYEAYERGTRLLTQQIRPRDWDATMLKHRRRLEQKELTSAFEQQQPGRIFSLPLMPRIRTAWAAVRSLVSRGPWDPPETQDRQLSRSTESAPSPSATWRTCDTATEADDGTEEADEVWRKEWRDDLAIMAPLKQCMFSCVAIGTKSLLEACGYWCMGSMYGDYRAGGAWAYWAVSIIFAALNVLIGRFTLAHLLHWQRNRGREVVSFKLWDVVPRPIASLAPACMRAPLVKIATEQPAEGDVVHAAKLWGLSLAPAGAPVLLTISAATRWPNVNRFLVPAGYLYHAVATLGVGVLAHNLMADAEDAEESTTGRFEDDGFDLSEVEAPSWARLESFSHRLSFFSFTSFGSSRSTGSSAAAREGVRVVKDMPRVMLDLSSLAIGLLWCGAFVWACITSRKVLEFNRQQQQWADLSVTLGEVMWDGRTKVEFTDGTTDNNSPYFFPHAVTCPEGQRVFMANKYQVFELDTRAQKLVQVDCFVNSSIKDVAVQCNKGRCWPVVLITEGRSSWLFECHSGKRWPLLQTQAPVSAIALRANNGSAAGWVNGAMNDLIAVVDEAVPKVMQYNFSAWRRGFYPWGGPLFKLQRGVTLNSIDLVEAEAGNWSHDRLLLFRDTSGASTVEIQDISSGVHCGSWTIPDLDGFGPEQMVGGGCAYAAGSSMFVLFGPGTVGRKLVNSSLPLQESLDEMCQLQEKQRRLARVAADACMRHSTGSRCREAR